MSPDDAALIERLPSMTVVQLREVARAEALPITYIAQRPKPELLKSMTAALAARSG